VGNKSIREWEVWCDSGQYRKHCATPSFAALLTLARIVNNLRYHHVAARSVMGDDSPSSSRQRITSFLNVAGALYEALLFAERLGEFFGKDEAFADIRDVLRSPVVQMLRNGPLKRLRHQAVYHHDEHAIANVLGTIMDGDKYVFASGTTLSKADVYYELADITVFHHALPGDSDARSFPERLQAFFLDAADLTIKFGNAADRLIANQLKEGGWRTTRAP
jgi:hypothetical protein